MDKYVIYFGGGTMRGVFSAGVAKAFEDNNFYQKISAVYGASAGAMTGAYFLARQTELGASIYWEDLGHNFVSYKGFWVGVWQRFQNKFIKSVRQENFYDALNVDYLMQIVKNDKCLNFQKIISQDIPFSVKLFNLDSHLVEYIDARCSDIFKILQTSVSPFPYIHKVSIINGPKYIDAAIMDIVGINLLKKRHPNEKIIVVINGQTDRKLRYRLKNILEGKFMEWMFGDAILYKIYVSAEDELIKDLEVIKSDPSIFLIAPDKNIPVKSRTTNPKQLIKLYHLGIKLGEDFLKNLK